MANKDLLYYLAFSHFLGIGPIRFAALKKSFGTVKKAYSAGKKEIAEIIGTGLAERFADFKNKFDPVKKLEEIGRKNIVVVCIDDEKYPRQLKNISDPPICIYIKSSIENFLSLPFLFFAIVGTRSPTNYGIQVAEKFSRELTEAGLAIVSGMAYGIDTAAHRSCLNIGGKTVAVLGCGVDVVYPAANSSLYEKIIANGLVVSEFPPGQTVVKGLFIARNRIISALSRGILVVEGAKDSGSLITARYAAEQGKDVFALPGPVTSKYSEAPNLLIKQGAKLVTTVNDIFEELDIKITLKKEEDILEKLNKEEKEIFLLLKQKPFQVDDLGAALKKPISQVLNTLSLMEIKGIVEKNNENRYQIKL